VAWALLNRFGRWMQSETTGLPSRAVPPGLEAGSVRRRMVLWQPMQQHINAAMYAAGPTVLSRARHLVRNNGYARAAIRSWSSSTVGAGIKPSSLLTDQRLREAVNAAWLTWTDEADAEGVTDFYGLARRVAREAYLAGETFIRLRPRLPRDGLTVPLQLQMLPAEQLPLSKIEVAPNGNPIRLGIEFDRNLRERRVAYWFYRANPVDTTLTFPEAMLAGELTRVPADEIIHVFDPLEAGQVRGLTGFHAAVNKLFHMDLYDEAELERKKQISRYATFITQPDDRDPTTGNPLNPRPEDDDSVYGPGASVLLYPGEDVKFSAPGEVGSSYEPFQYRTLLQISAALGVPYAELSTDLTKATYASSRAGLLAFRQEIEAFQHGVLVFNFLRRVWDRWMDAAVLAGAVPISAQAYNANLKLYRAMKAITPRAAWVDPLKDLQAEVLAIRAGVKAPQDVVEAMGYDLEEVYKRIAEAKALAESLGLTFDLSWSSQGRGSGPVEGADNPVTTEDAAA
jgi:lambda family phage portal protein